MTPRLVTVTGLVRNSVTVTNENRGNLVDESVASLQGERQHAIGQYSLDGWST